MLLAKLAGAMMASLSQAVYLFNAPLAQAARLAAALQEKAEEDPSILGGGAGEPAAGRRGADADRGRCRGDAEPEEAASEAAAEATTEDAPRRPRAAPRPAPTTPTPAEA